MSVFERNELVKYPRTPHLPFSPGMTSDDKMVSAAGLVTLQSCGDLVVTEKMDGGNVTMTNSHFFARSLDSGTHPWDTHAKALHASVKHDIPVGWRVSGESLYAQRSVAYTGLRGPFYVFGIWDEQNNLLSWDDTEEWAEMLGLPIVPTLYRGADFEQASDVWFQQKNPDISEGFVMRNADQFPYDDFNVNVAKYVRANHVQTSSDWRHRDDFAVNGFAE